MSQRFSLYSKYLLLVGLFLLTSYQIAATCAPAVTQPAGKCIGGFPGLLPICEGGSPIVIDTTGGGFKFTDPQTKYVTFDLLNTGSPIKISWTQQGSGNAWLVLPDANGNVSSGAQLFGDHTPQPASDHPDGYKALQQWDSTTNGGNQNGVIDSGDAVFSNLRLWIDTHCYTTPNVACTALPGELFTLPSKGINSLGFVPIMYSPQNWDQWGNNFKLAVVVNPIHRAGESAKPQVSGDSLGRLSYDVWLANQNTTVPPAGTQMTMATPQHEAP